MLVSQGVDDTRCWVVEQGAVASFVVGPSGHRALLEILGPGDLATGSPVTWPAGNGSGPDPVRPELRALSPGRVLVVPGGDLAAAMAADHDVLSWVHERVAARLRRIQAALADALTLPVHERLHRFLLDLALRYGQAAPGGVRIGIPLTQETLAAAAGSARETVNRALRTLQAEARVTRVGRTYVVTADDPSTEPSGTAGLPPRPSRPGPRPPA